MVIVHELQVPGDVTESLPGDVISNWAIVEVWISAPVIIDGWQVIDSHKDGESEEGFEFLNSNRIPPLVCILSHELPGILVALLHNV